MDVFPRAAYFFHITFFRKQNYNIPDFLWGTFIRKWFVFVQRFKRQRFKSGEFSSVLYSFSLYFRLPRFL